MEQQQQQPSPQSGDPIFQSLNNNDGDDKGFLTVIRIITADIENLENKIEMRNKYIEIYKQFIKLYKTIVKTTMGLEVINICEETLKMERKCLEVEKRLIKIQKELLDCYEKQIHQNNQLKQLNIPEIQFQYYLRHFIFPPVHMYTFC